MDFIERLELGVFKLSSLAGELIGIVANGVREIKIDLNNQG